MVTPSCKGLWESEYPAKDAGSHPGPGIRPPCAKCGPISKRESRESAPGQADVSSVSAVVRAHGQMASFSFTQSNPLI